MSEIPPHGRPLYPTPAAYTTENPHISKTAYTGIDNDQATAPPPLALARKNPALFIPRTALLLIGPFLVTAGFAFIARYYLWNESENGIVPNRPINAKGVFYAWLILSIFVLDWSKSALAGFEAAVLMRERTAVDEIEERRRRKQILTWHADHGWGALSVWGKAIVTLGKYIVSKPRWGHKITWDGPGLLWWYLALTTFLFTAIIPLSGLAMNTTDAFTPSHRPVVIIGPNETTFDILPSNDAAEQASNRWRTHLVTTPDGPTIFYAPQGVANVSTTWFEDEIQSDCISRTNISMAGRSRMANRTVTFFSGPRVSERAYGRAWGLLTTLSCMPVHPYKDLRLLSVKSMNNWTSPSGLNSQHFDGAFAQVGAGFSPVHSDKGEDFGVSWQYVLPTTGDVSAVFPEYGNASTLPLSGSVELVLWQGYGNERGTPIPDKTFNELPQHPFVVQSNPKSNTSITPYLGFGVRCDVTSSVGTASISAEKRTYSDFQKLPSKTTGGRISGDLFRYPGILSLHTLVFEAFTTLTAGFMGAPKCGLPSIQCSPWIGANRATGGAPVFSPTKEPSPGVYTGGTMQLPTIDPERMNLAMYKLFGETAIVLMASSPGNWISTPNSSAEDPNLGLFGFKSVSDLEPFTVPPMFILVMLGVWTLAMVVPPLAFGMLWTKRDVEVVDGDLLWRFGVAHGQEMR